MNETPTSLDDAKLRRASRRLAKCDVHLATVLSELGPPPLWKRPANFATLVRIILEQQVSLASAKSTFDRIRAQCQGRLTPTRVQQLGQPALRSLGVTRQKARYIDALAGDVLSGELRIGRLRHLPDQALRDQLTSRLGLGNWSADVFMLMALCRPDVLPSGDLALVKGMRELDGGSYDSAEAVIARAESWRPFRSVATRMIWQFYLHRRGQTVP